MWFYSCGLLDVELIDTKLSSRYEIIKRIYIGNSVFWWLRLHSMVDEFPVNNIILCQLNQLLLYNQPPPQDCVSYINYKVIWFSKWRHQDILFKINVEHLNKRKSPHLQSLMSLCKNKYSSAFVFEKKVR